MSCKFCDRNLYESFRVMQNDEPYIDLRIDNSGGDVAILAVGDNIGVYRPKYCPECGRRLVFDEEEDHEANLCRQSGIYDV